MIFNINHKRVCHPSECVTTAAIKSIKSNVRAAIDRLT